MNEKTIKTLHRVTLGLLALIVVLQFVPFWSTAEGDVSVNSYIWFPGSNTALTEQIRSTVDADFILDDAFVWGPILQTVLGVITLCLYKKRNIATVIFAFIAGLAGTLAFALHPVFRAGNLWILFLLLSAAVVVLSVLLLIEAIREKRS